MKTAIITGAAGYTGSRLMHYLADHGIQVIALDSKQITCDRQGITVYTIDLLDRNSLQLFKDLRADIFYHMAWIGVGAQSRNDYDVQQLNISLTLRSLDIARCCGVRKYIFPGSASEFAMSGSIINGMGVPAPSDAYGATKSACRIIAQTFAKQNSIPLIPTTISSIYGPGRDDDNIITYSIKSLLLNKKTSFTGLEQKWDYIYISDLLHAFYLIGKSGSPGRAYAIGSGIALPLYEYITFIRDSINPSLRLGIGEKKYKMGIPDSVEIDLSAIKNDVHFVPAISIKVGLQKTIQYYRDNLPMLDPS